jgi:hypothetical protein
MLTFLREMSMQFSPLKVKHSLWYCIHQANAPKCFGAAYICLLVDFTATVTIACAFLLAFSGLFASFVLPVIDCREFLQPMLHPGCTQPDGISINFCIYPVIRMVLIRRFICNAAPLHQCDESTCLFCDYSQICGG